MRRIPELPVHQSGAVLYVALVFLVLLALLGLAGMQVSMMQERMSANYRATNVAFQLAESVARERESEIESTFKAGGMFISDQERCDPAFDPMGWAQAQSIKDSPVEESRTRRIDYCTPGFSLAQGVRPESEKSDQMYQVTAFAPDDVAAPTSDAAIDTIFIP
ncbi:MAG: pilus assembly PilX family protein [Stenotrophomonas sp.]